MLIDLAISAMEADFEFQLICGERKYSLRPNCSSLVIATAGSFLLAIECKIPRRSSALRTSTASERRETSPSSRSTPSHSVLSRSQTTHFMDRCFAWAPVPGVAEALETCWPTILLNPFCYAGCAWYPYPAMVIC